MKCEGGILTVASDNYSNKLSFIRGTCGPQHKWNWKMQILMMKVSTNVFSLFQNSLILRCLLSMWACHCFHHDVAVNDNDFLMKPIPTLSSLWPSSSSRCVFSLVTSASCREASSLTSRSECRMSPVLFLIFQNSSHNNASHWANSNFLKKLPSPWDKVINPACVDEDPFPDFSQRGIKQVAGK